MDQDQNNNLFLNDQEPQQPVEPAAEEPVVSSGAQIYGAAPEISEPAEQPPFVPPPPTVVPAAPPPSNNRTLWIVLIVVLLLLVCCCCLAIVGVAGWFWNNGDRLLQDFNSLAPQLSSLMA